MQVQALLRHPPAHRLVGQGRHYRGRLRGPAHRQQHDPGHRGHLRQHAAYQLPVGHRTRGDARRRSLPPLPLRHFARTIHVFVTAHARVEPRLHGTVLLYALVRRPGNPANGRTQLLPLATAQAGLYPADSLHRQDARLSRLQPTQPALLRKLSPMRKFRHRGRTGIAPFPLRQRFARIHLPMGRGTALPQMPPYLAAYRRGLRQTLVHLHLQAVRQHVHVSRHARALPHQPEDLHYRRPDSRGRGGIRIHP